MLNKQNTTGDVSNAVENTYGVDVAVFSTNTTTDVALKRKWYVYSSFSVLGTSTFGNTLSLSTNSGGGGGIRVVAATTGNEAAIGYYTRSGSRSCFNISDTGTITADYKVRTPLLMTDTIRGNGANQITIDDNVMITGNLVWNGSLNYKPVG